MKFTSLRESLSQMLLVGFRRDRDRVTPIRSILLGLLGENDQIYFILYGEILFCWMGYFSLTSHLQYHLLWDLLVKILHFLQSELCIGLTNVALTCNLTQPL